MRLPTRRSFLRMLAVAGVTVLAACASGGGGRGASSAAEVVVINGSNETIYRIFMSPSSQTRWGPDQLGSNVLMRGNSFRLTGIAPGRWDIKVVDRSGNYKTFFRQTLRGGRVYTINVNGNNWIRPNS